MHSALIDLSVQAFDLMLLFSHPPFPSIRQDCFTDEMDKCYNIYCITRWDGIVTALVLSLPQCIMYSNIITISKIIISYIDISLESIVLVI